MHGIQNKEADALLDKLSDEQLQNEICTRTQQGEFICWGILLLCMTG